MIMEIYGLQFAALGAGASLGRALTTTSTRKKLKRETVPQVAVRGGERQGVGEGGARIAGAVSEGDGAKEGKTRLSTPPLRKEEDEKFVEKTRQEVMVVADVDVAGGERGSEPGRDWGRRESPESLQDLPASDEGPQQRCHDGGAGGQGGGQRQGWDAQISGSLRLPLPPQAAAGSEGKPLTWSSLFAPFNAREGAVTKTSDDTSNAGAWGHSCKGASFASGSPKEHSQEHSKEHPKEHQKGLGASRSSGAGAVDAYIRQRSEGRSLFATCVSARSAEHHKEHPGQRPAAVWKGQKDSLVLETSGEIGKGRGAPRGEVALKREGVVKENQDSCAGIKTLYKILNDYIIH